MESPDALSASTFPAGGPVVTAAGGRGRHPLQRPGRQAPTTSSSPLTLHGIPAAFVFRSVAKGIDHAGSDIDLMVISDEPRYLDVFEAVQEAERRLARPINPTVMSVADWRAKRGQEDSFTARVAAQPKLFVIGSDDELA